MPKKERLEFLRKQDDVHQRYVKLVLSKSTKKKGSEELAKAQEHLQDKEFCNDVMEYLVMPLLYDALDFPNQNYSGVGYFEETDELLHKYQRVFKEGFAFDDKDLEKNLDSTLYEEVSSKLALALNQCGKFLSELEARCTYLGDREGAAFALFQNVFSGASVTETKALFQSVIPPDITNFRASLYSLRDWYKSEYERLRVNKEILHRKASVVFGNGVKQGGTGLPF